MRSNELRLGNWVLNNGKPYQILNGIDNNYIYGLDSVILDSHIYKSSLEYIDPITLTEEILLKCGFESDYKSIYAKYIPNDGGYFHIKYNSHNNGFYLVLHGFYVARIKHLHQLQNLYFALTGEELNIEL